MFMASSRYPSAGALPRGTGGSPHLERPGGGRPPRRPRLARHRPEHVCCGQDPNRLDGVTWHTLRHTFASRFILAGADLRTVAGLGGGRALAMVQRCAHRSPGHLRAAVERLVDVSRKWPDGVEAEAAASAVVG
jgi:integrase